MARLVFESIEIQDDRVMAVVPQSEFAPFCVRRAVDEGLLQANNNGATEVTPSSEAGTTATPAAPAPLPPGRPAGASNTWVTGAAFDPVRVFTAFEQWLLSVTNGRCIFVSDNPA